MTYSFRTCGSVYCVSSIDRVFCCVSYFYTSASIKCHGYLIRYRPCSVRNARRHSLILSKSLFRGVLPFYFSLSRLRSYHLQVLLLPIPHTHILEPIGSAIFLLEERLSIVKLPCLAPFTLGRIGAVEEWNMPVSDVLEPMHSTLLLKQSQCNGMDGCIPPTFVEESACAIEVFEIRFIRFRTPKVHVGDFKVAPEMAGRVSVCNLIVFRSPFLIGQPSHGIIFGEILVIPCQKFNRLGPKLLDTLRRIVDVDRETIGLVVVSHISEDIIIHIAEEIDMWFHTPIVLYIFERGVFVE